MYAFNTVKIFAINDYLQEKINNFFIEKKDTMVENYSLQVYEHLKLVIILYHDVNFNKN